MASIFGGVRSFWFAAIYGSAAVFSNWVFCQEKVEVAVSSQLILNQHAYSDSPNACGPASVFNLLKFGPESYRKAQLKLVGANDKTRFRFLIERYFKNRPSVVTRGEKRWGSGGVMSADLVEGLNELLLENELPKLGASYLDRKEGESDYQFLGRIHKWMRKSLDRGVPPILSLRSFVVRQREENDRKPGWESAKHHYVVITSLPAKLAESPPVEGFEAAIIDANGATQQTIYIHLESNGQSFRALKGLDRNGQWLDGRSFLLVNAPRIRSLRPAKLKWSERIIVTANFLIGDF